MDINNSKIESELKCCSQNSLEDLIKYVLFEIQSPIEDYYLAIDILIENYPKYKDIRIAIIGSYLSSTWQKFKKNVFLQYLKDHLCSSDNYNKSIIYYLFAYDIYMKNEKNYPMAYARYLKKSIFYFNGFVYNYIRLAEISNRKESKKLIDCAIKNVITVWSEEQLQNVPFEEFLRYETFINEFILGIDMSYQAYRELVNKRIV